MKKPVVQSPNPVTLIGGGAVYSEDFAYALARAPDLVAADGGALAALDRGYTPLAVIGDMDSLPTAARSLLPPETVFPITEQDSTDFDKALRSISAPLVLAIGFLGRRLDHQLAAFSTLIRRSNIPCILIGELEVIFHAPADFTMELEPGSIVSLYPMARVTGRSEGLEWPIDGLQLAPDGRIGTSNRALGRVRLSVDGPGLLVIVPRSALDAVMRAIVPES
ncbi:thiamine diphosphokinase [Rhodobacteraceae bacterium M382]|nr:thiamine diphosphokinase [Rhodobacteraceae bacterium M382]